MTDISAIGPKELRINSVPPYFPICSSQFFSCPSSHSDAFLVYLHYSACGFGKSELIIFRFFLMCILKELSQVVARKGCLIKPSSVCMWL